MLNLTNLGYFSKSEGNFNFKSFLQTLNITAQEFDEIFKKIKELQLKKRKKIRFYYHLLKQIEQERTETFKCILRNNYKNLIKTSHKTPHEIENYFENEIVVCIIINTG